MCSLLLLTFIKTTYAADYSYGDVLISSSNRVYTISSMDDERILFTNGSSSRDLDGWTQSVPVLGNLGPGILTVSSNDYVGTFVNVFADGRVQMQRGSSLSVYSSASPQVDEYNGARAGILARSETRVYTIDTVFENGKIQASRGHSRSALSSYSPQVPDTTGREAGTKIVSGTRVYTANAFFADGSCYANRGHSYSIVTDYPTEVSGKDGATAGMIVLNGTRVYEILHVFSDGRVQAKRGHSTSVLSSYILKVKPSTRYRDLFHLNLR